MSFLRHHPSCVLGHGVLLAWSSYLGLGRLSREPQGSSCLCLPALGFQACRSSCVRGKNFPHELFPRNLLKTTATILYVFTYRLAFQKKVLTRTVKAAKRGGPRLQRLSHEIVSLCLTWLHRKTLSQNQTGQSQTRASSPWPRACWEWHGSFETSKPLSGDVL